MKGTFKKLKNCMPSDPASACQLRGPRCRLPRYCIEAGRSNGVRLCPVRSSVRTKQTSGENFWPSVFQHRTLRINTQGCVICRAWFPASSDSPGLLQCSTLAHYVPRSIVKLRPMNATTKFGFALLVVALLLFQPIGKCFATAGVATAHECCPAPAQSKCAMSACACASTAPSGAVVLSNTNDVFVAVVFTAQPQATDVSAPPVPEREPSRRAQTHRFIALHQFLI